MGLVANKIYFWVARSSEAQGVEDGSPRPTLRLSVPPKKNMAEIESYFEPNTMRFNSAKGRQRGVVVVIVLVCLMVAVGMSAAVLSQIAAERRVVQSSQRSLQAAWLAEAGIERAAAKLANNSSYVGETWTISAKELAAGEGATVTIRVEPVAGRAERRAVRVEADFGDSPERRARRTKQITIDRETTRTK
jgi:hypothetical protein